MLQSSHRYKATLSQNLMIFFSSYEKWLLDEISKNEFVNRPKNGCLCGQGLIVLVNQKQLENQNQLHSKTLDVQPLLFISFYLNLSGSQMRLSIGHTKMDDGSIDYSFYTIMQLHFLLALQIYIWYLYIMFLQSCSKNSSGSYHVAKIRLCFHCFVQQERKLNPTRIGSTKFCKRMRPQCYIGTRKSLQESKAIE